MSEQEKKWQRIYDLLNSEIKSKKIYKIMGISLWLWTSQDFNLFDYAVSGVLEKTNATSHPNIGLFKTAIEEEWNEMFVEFILKAFKAFWKCWYNKWKNNGCIE